MILEYHKRSKPVCKSYVCRIPDSLSYICRKLVSARYRVEGLASSTYISNNYAVPIYGHISLRRAPGGFFSSWKDCSSLQIVIDSHMLFSAQSLPAMIIFPVFGYVKYS